MPRTTQRAAWGQGPGWVTYLAAGLALATAIVVASAQPSGERETSDQAEVLGVQLERPALPAPVAVPAVTTTPAAPAGGELVALPGGSDAGSRSLEKDWVIGLTLLAVGLTGLGLVAASNPHRRRTAIGPPA
jgi:hypothetical protein